MPSTETLSYPWQSRAVYVAELDAEGLVLRANRALADALNAPPEGVPIEDLITREQRPSLQRLLDGADEEWQQATFGFLGDHSEVVQDRCVWLRRLPGGTLELVAEPAWGEYIRLVEQVLQLNDDLIDTQRNLARGQRDLQRAQDQANRAAHRVGQLEAIVLAALTPQGFDESLSALLAIAQEILPGDRAEILLLDDAGDRLETRARSGSDPPAQPPGHSKLAAGPLGEVAASGVSLVVDDVALIAAGSPGGRSGSLIAAPLRTDGQVIGVLAASAPIRRSFSEEDLRLLEAVAERVGLAIGQARVRQREQRLAETLARTLLPQEMPQVPGLRIATAYRALATNVGGDFYDAVLLPSGNIGVAIGDVTGKGLRAAATMGRLRSALHAYALDCESPAEVLRRLDRLARADRVMATAIYLVLDPVGGRVELSSAGHLPPLLIGGGTGGYLDIGQALSPPLGLGVERRREMVMELGAGEGMVLYTDGLVEGNRDLDSGLGELQSAAGTNGFHDLQGLCDGLIASLAAGGRYRDDVAVLALQRAG